MKKMKINALLSILFLVLWIEVSNMRVYAWFIPEPEVEAEEARESFWEYEKRTETSAWNVFLDNAEDFANLGMLSDFTQTLNDIWDFFSGSKEVVETYDSPYTDDFMRTTDTTVRLLNQTPFSIYIPQIITTVVYDFCNYKVEEWRDSNWVKIANLFFEEEMAHIYSTFGDSFNEDVSKNKADAYRAQLIFELIKAFSDAKKAEDETRVHVSNTMNKTPNDMNALKPNIYLYGIDDNTISIKFLNESLLLYVIPDYEKSWMVASDGTGTLEVDGESGFEYLFYESATSSALMQTQEGFYIGNDNRSDQLSDLMEAYGFNEKEISDFVTYWDEKLDKDVHYLVYPQLTQTVDDAMPLEISGIDIDSYYRIWFYFAEADPDTPAPPVPEIQPVRHDGVSLIEWGVVR